MGALSLVGKGSFLDTGGVCLLSDTGLTTSPLTRTHPRTSYTEQLQPLCQTEWGSASTGGAGGTGVPAAPGRKGRVSRASVVSKSTSQAPTSFLPVVRASAGLGITDVLVRDQEEGHLPLFIFYRNHIQETPEWKP